MLGGTGPEGLGIAARLAAAGEQVIVGSRQVGRAAEAAATLAGEVPGGRLRGAANPDAAAGAKIVFVAVPLSGVPAILDECAAILDLTFRIDSLAFVSIPVERPGRIDML